MKLYIYDTATNEIVAVATGEDHLECERKAASLRLPEDEYGWSYSPAFGTVDGLKMGPADEIEWV